MVVLAARQLAGVWRPDNEPLTRWQEAQDDAHCIGWAREFYDATRPYASGTEYVNFLSEDETERLSRTYGGNFARLSQIKAKYDPGNIFRVNQNIRP